MKLKIILILITIFLLVVGCGKLAIEDQPVEESIVEEELEIEEDLPSQLDEPEETVNISCSNNDQCEWNQKCINSQCGKLSELYETDCDDKCNFNTVIVETSDQETYTLNRGQGSYTLAGALAWNLLSGPDYCPGDTVIIPVELIMKNFGKVVGKQVVTVNLNEDSAVITHPNITDISFTLKVTDVNESCS